LSWWISGRKTVLLLDSVWAESDAEIADELQDQAAGEEEESPDVGPGLGAHHFDQPGDLPDAPDIEKQAPDSGVNGDLLGGYIQGAANLEQDSKLTYQPQVTIVHIRYASIGIL